jgi:hypothetical protein
MSNDTPNGAQSNGLPGGIAIPPAPPLPPPREGWGPPRSLTQEEIAQHREAEQRRQADQKYEKKKFARLHDLMLEDDARAEFMAYKANKLFKEPDAPFSLAEELAKPDEPLTPRIEGLSYVGSRVTIAAKAKAGKTTLEINLARALADGTPFLGGLAVTPPVGNVGVVNYEMSSTQLNTWFRNAGIVRQDRIVPLHLQGRMMPLVSPKTQDWFIKWVIERNVEVLIMDPWSKRMVGCGSENSNDDVANVTAILDHIKEEAGIKDLFVVAHMGHGEFEDGSERARGASAFMGWPDVMWHLNRSGDIRLLQAEGRDISFPSQELVFEATTHTVRLTGVQATKSQINVKKAADEVVAIVTNLPGLSTADLKAKITATSNAGQKADAITEAINAGRIHRRDGKRTEKLHYPGPDPAMGGVALSDPGIQGFLRTVGGAQR